MVGTSDLSSSNLIFLIAEMSGRLTGGHWTNFNQNAKSECSGIREKFADQLACQTALARGLQQTLYSTLVSHGLGSPQ